MEELPEKCAIEHYLIKPSLIHYLRFVLEAYEGIATMTTRDSSLGWIQLNIAPGCEMFVEQVLTCEKERLGLRNISVTGV